MVSKTNKKNRLRRRRRTRRRTKNMPKPVREIYGRHRPGGNGHKYYLDCSADLNKLIATQVLSSTKIRTIMSGVKNEGDTHREIIAKVTKMSKKNTNQAEYQHGNLLQNIQGFIRYICLVTCTTQLQNPETVTLPSQICDKESIPSKTSTILIMPYYKDGSMEEFPWKESDVVMCKSCLQQIVLSLYQAFKYHGFLHNDPHFNNILLEKTEEPTVTYDDITVPTHGYKTCITDFDNSYVVDFADKTKHRFFWYDIRTLFSRIPTDLIVIFQEESYRKITQFVSDGCNQHKPVDTCVELLPLIDQLKLDHIKPLHQSYVYKQHNSHNDDDDDEEKEKEKEKEKES